LLKLYFSNDFKGEGISAGLQRGLLIDFAESCLVQEGMGLGAPAIKTKTGTYFSTTSILTNISPNVYIKEFTIDSELLWKIFGSDSEQKETPRLLTTFINKLNDLYKKAPYIQKSLLKLGIVSRDFFCAKSRPTKIGSLGKIRFKYKILKNSVHIWVDVSDIMNMNGERISKICILNELGGDFFDARKLNSHIFKPPAGWVKIEEVNPPILHSKELGIDFSLKIINNTPNLKYELVYGREKISNFCWAGFDIEIDAKSLGLDRADYQIEYVCEFNKI
jgi:hypothetical protein